MSKTEFRVRAWKAMAMLCAGVLMLGAVASTARRSLGTDQSDANAGIQSADGGRRDVACGRSARQGRDRPLLGELVKHLRR